MSKKKENYARDTIIAMIVIGGLFWGCFASSEKITFVYIKTMERLAETYCNRKAESVQDQEVNIQGIEAIIQETPTGVFVWTSDFYTMDKIISDVEDWGCIVKLTGNGMEIDMSKQRKAFMMHTNTSISYTDLLTAFMITTPKHL